MPYEFRGDIAHADIAFDASGSTLEELFSAAAEATLKVMAEDPTAVRPTETVRVSLAEESLEMLLFEFLNELIFYKDARRLLLRPQWLEIGSEGVDSYQLQAALQGEEIDACRHQLDTDVKAVTMLRLSVHQVPGGWQATVVLDV
ncbi:archease [Geomonas limicola]|uniref:Archease n=1 Tax=Geomonas limicola TaxID=2740186 RepID=A0A6V8NGK7_9BACT|nr:archease [Geomonas limicola]GFO70773.1 archease [Geomonas limicola]